MPDISLVQVALLQLFVLGASTAVGITSFGFGMIMSPLFLLFIDPRLVVELNVALFAFLMASVAFQSRHHLDKGMVLVLTLAAMTMMPLGILVINALDDQSLRFFIIGTVLLMVLVPMTRVRHTFKREKLAAIPVGAALGFLYTTVALGGPLVVLFALNQRWGKDRTRANLSAFFAVSGIIVLLFHSFTGLYGTSELTATALFLPSLIVGSLLASRLVNHVNERLFRIAVLVVLFGASLGILGRELYRIFE